MDPNVLQKVKKAVYGFIRSDKVFPTWKSFNNIPTSYKPENEPSVRGISASHSLKPPSMPNLSLLAPKKSLTISPSESKKDQTIAIRSWLIRETSADGKKSWPSVGEIPANVLKTDSNVNHIGI